MAKFIFLHSHPIQYLAPLYNYLAKSGLALEVLYCSKHGLQGELDKEFKTKVKWDLDLLSGYPNSFLKNNGSSKGIYSFFGLTNWSVVKQVKNMDKDDILVLHGWNYATYIMAFLAGVRYKKRLALRTETPLNQETSKSGIKHSLRNLFIKKFFLKRFNYVFYMGNQNRAFYLDNNIPDQKLYFTPYCVDNDRFTKASNALNKTTLRKEYGLPEDAFVFLYSGKLIPKKRPLDLIDAAARIPSNKDVYFIFMGDGELREEMEKEISKNNLQNVVITGFVNQSKVSEYYALSNCFVMCSGSGETWGLSTNEAMNFKLPILVSETCGNAKDLVQNGINGYTFKESNTVELVQKLDLMLNKSETEMNSMGLTSHEIISAYSYETIKSNIQSLV